MDGTAGHTAGPADGAAGPAGRTDPTGPLPVGTPAAPTGPLPVPQAGSWFTPGSASTTAPQPTVDTSTAPDATSTGPPSWFATGPLPAVPPAPAGPDAGAGPAGPPAPPVGTVDLFDANQSRPTATTPPIGLFEPTVAPQTNGRTPASAGPGTPPPTGLIPAVAPHPMTPVPATSAQPSAPPVAGPPAAQAPPTSLFPAIGRQTPATNDLFTPAGPRNAGPAGGPPAPTGGVPAARPVAAPAPVRAVGVAPAPAGTAPVGAAPYTPAPVRVAPAGAATTGFAPVSAAPVSAAPVSAAPVSAAPVSAAPVSPAPVSPAPVSPAPVSAAPVSAAPVAATLVGAAPVARGGGAGPWSAAPPATETPARTDISAPQPEPAGTESSSFSPEDRRSGAKQSWPLPATGGRAHTGATPPSGSAPAVAPTPAKRRRAWPLTLVGVLVAVAAGIALVFSIARTDPADLATRAATEAGTWPGAHYTGTVATVDGGVIQLDVTVTPDGARGTLSRDGGRATAELLSDPGGTLMRANREWWLYHHPTRADDLADSWVAEPLTETQEVGPVLRLNPAALAEHVRGEPPAPWAALEQQLVDGRPGIVLFDGARRVVVGSDGPHPLLAVDAAPGASTAPIQVARSTDEQIAAASGAAARVRQEAAPRTLAQLLLERPMVDIQLQPEPLCTAQNCNVTVVVTNSGTAPARGRLEISADGKIVANHPLEVHPGQVATFTAAAPNPHFAQPGATGQILWETRAVDD